MLYSRGAYDLSSLMKSVDVVNGEEKTHLMIMHVANGYQLLCDVNVLVKCLPPNTDIIKLGTELAGTVTKVC